MKSYSESYKAAGVDVTAGYESVRLMKNDVERTKIPGCISGIGGFGGLFMPDLSGMTEPVLVSGTDGVGTKLKIAMLMNKNDTIGIDCVAMCVNDIICCGAKPLYFLDYIAIGKNVPEKVAEIVKGVADGCVTAGCALVGGETAEHPGMMPEDEYDIAGYSTGIVDKSKIIDNSQIKVGDAVIGIASSGVHSNGFSLVRKVFNINDRNLNSFVPELGQSLGEALLTPTRIYVKPVLELIEKLPVKGVSHITGGGFYENIPRMLPEGISAKITKGSWDIPPIFALIQKEGNISGHDMFNTFNMGVGMAVVVDGENAERAVEILGANGEKAFVIGETVSGDDGVVFDN
ncbi:MAG: phosphoribosylformylglycinamidine cyclo-ligase [Lachnospiraceae bacterium]|nr:phosphoribosylformylglycinamidine cyclo-ligase [Ruminococcus sp.]MCM1276194.1 phosphoribosylformylglycinamidine cyclo-ligase [Lachnospiraceae bacterium]